jgi:serine/threonine protein kinase
MTNLVGRQLGQYTLVKQIGKGGMATVYLARQESIGREVALPLAFAL